MKCPACKRNYKLHCRCKEYHKVKREIIEQSRNRFEVALVDAIRRATNA